MSSQVMQSSRNRAISRNELEGLEGQILRQMSGRGRDIRIVPTKEGLVLRGRVHTYYAKQLAQHVLLKSTHLPLAANEIVVV